MNAVVLDSLNHTVRVVRTPDGDSHLIVIRCAHPWVLRKPILVPEDFD